MRAPAVFFFVLCLVSAFNLGCAFYIRKHPGNHHYHDEPEYAADADDSAHHAGHGQSGASASGITTYSGPNRAHISPPGIPQLARGVDASVSVRSRSITDEEACQDGITQDTNAESPLTSIQHPAAAINVNEQVTPTKSHHTSGSSHSGFKYFRNTIHAWLFGFTYSQHQVDNNPQHSTLPSSASSESLESTVTPISSESPGPYRIGFQRNRSRPSFRKRRHP